MSQTNIGLYLSNISNKNQILELILKNHFLHEYVDLSLLQGALYSTITINRLVEEELRHDKITIQTTDNPSLATMSSGQQKKALLSYLIAQKPQYIVLDDVYSNIDKTTQASITSSLSILSETTLLIQIFFRKRDLLPCINTIYTVDGFNKIIKEEDITTFLASNLEHEHQLHRFKIPKQYDENHIDINPLIQMNDVSVKYGDKRVLNKVNWTIQQGEFWQLVGPNGSGKSTILSLITGDNPRGYGQNMILFGKKKGSGESIWDIKRRKHDYFRSVRFYWIIYKTD